MPTRAGIISALLTGLLLSPWGVTGGQDTSPPAAPVAPALPAAAHRWALLVGVDDYAELADLQHPSLALRQLQFRLTAAGFPLTNVFVVSDQAPLAKYRPSKANIERQVELIASLPGEDDLLVVVLCGRVLHHEDRLLLCPLDAMAANTHRSAIDLQAIFDRIAASSARHKLMVLDLTPVSDSDPSGVLDPLIRRWREPPAGMSVWFSCGEGQASVTAPSLDWTVFLHCLVRAWDGAADEQGNGDGLVSLGELSDHVAAETERQARAVAKRPQSPLLVGSIPRGVPWGRVAKYASVQASYPVIEDDVGAASARLEAIVRIHPQSLRAYRQALAAYGHGDLIEAINLATDALRYDPGNTWTLILRASSYAAFGDLVKALEDYRELGIPLPCTVRAEQANLYEDGAVVATLRQGDKAYALRAEGDRLYVQIRLVDGVKSGWIEQSKLE